MYHRIADNPADFFNLSVSPARFEEQLQVLRQTRYPLPLIDFVRNLMAGTLPSNAVALTFDDGYVDNLVAGKPRLAAADVAATVFLITGFIDGSKPFLSDELARLFLLEKGPQHFALMVGGELMHFDFGSESPAGSDAGIPAGSVTRRREGLNKMAQALKALAYEERELVMDELRSIFAGSDYRASLGRAMTRNEVRELVADGLVTIGAHTVTHPMLTGIEAAACHREISDSRRACESIIDAPVKGFAYPFGDFDAKAREAVKTAGFTFACSTKHGPAFTTSDILALPRIHVSNWDGDAFERALRSA
jgi:peptidoglycan/xylan/chitin deacetylase (PgdA/CDA1 family)